MNEDLLTEDDIDTMNDEIKDEVMEDYFKEEY